MGIFNTIRRLTERFSNHLSAIKFEKVSVMTIQSQLSTFNFESKSIRTLAINNEPWFVAVDICRALNLSSPSMAIANEATRAGLEVSGTHIIIDYPENILRISGLIRDCLEFCQNDENFARKKSMIDIKTHHLY